MSSLLTLLIIKHFIYFHAKSYCLAHDDSIWSCAWGKSERDGTDNIITGSVDDSVKIWRWYGLQN